MWQRSLILFLFPFVLTSINAYFIVFNEGYYVKAFEKNDIYGKFQLPKEELNQELATILGFLRGKNELSPAFVNAREQAHMDDVKKLFAIGKWVTIFITIILLTTMVYTKDLRAVIHGTLTTIVLGLVFLLFIVLIFPKMFLWFHQLAFTNNLWMLNPETDNLIKLFPETLFYDTTFTIFKNTLMTASIIFAMALGYRHVKKSWKR